jgi:hypothetical protein
VAHLKQRLQTLPPDPKLHVEVGNAASFADERDSIDQLAHGGDPKRPVLWILDPFRWEPAPATLVDSCLRHLRDEIVLTFFVDEVYRFLNSPPHVPALTRYFGTDSWKKLRPLALRRDEPGCKEALIDLYRRELERRSGVRTGSFSVGVKNQTPRYALVFATHNEHGLGCWTPLTWRLDENSGQIHTMKPEQPDLFTIDVSPAEKLSEELKVLAGREVSWAELTDLTLRRNYLEKHLREALNLLGAAGFAIRVSPLNSRTPWPRDSVVRFYTTEDVEEA